MYCVKNKDKNHFFMLKEELKAGRDFTIASENYPKGKNQMTYKFSPTFLDAVVCSDACNCEYDRDQNLPNPQLQDSGFPSIHFKNDLSFGTGNFCHEHLQILCTIRIIKSKINEINQNNKEQQLKNNLQKLKDKERQIQKDKERQIQKDKEPQIQNNPIEEENNPPLFEKTLYALDTNEQIINFEKELIYAKAWKDGKEVKKEKIHKDVEKGLYYVELFGRFISNNFDKMMEDQIKVNDDKNEEDSQHKMFFESLTNNGRPNKSQ